MSHPESHGNLTRFIETEIDEIGVAIDITRHGSYNTYEGDSEQSAYRKEGNKNLKT